MRTIFFGILLALVFSSCKSKVCECADAHVEAVRAINKTTDPIKKMRVLGKKKYQKIFKECNAMTSQMTPEELKDFEAEYEQCPSVKALKAENQR